MKRTDGQKRLSARLTHRKAFTLVELLVVIAIIGILFVVLISKVDFATDKAKTAGAQTDLRSYELAAYTIGVEQQGFTSDLELLAEQLNKNLDPKLHLNVDGEHITTEAQDPWGKEYRITYNEPDSSRGQIIITSAGVDTKYDTEDDINIIITYTVDEDGGHVEIEMSNGAVNPAPDTPTEPSDPTDPDTPTEPEQGGEQEPVRLAAGLYDAEDNLVASWDELVNTYGMDIEKDYTYSTYKTDVFSPYYVLTNYDALSTGTKLVISDDSEKVGNYAFKNCSGLTSVVIGNSVSSIGNSAFSGCSGLTSVEIGNGVTSIGSAAFNDCSILTGVYITDLAAWCKIDFKYADSNPLNYAKKLYLNNTLITDLVIPDEITEIKPHTFYYANSITTLTLHDSVTSIGDFAFYYCSGLTSVTIGNSVTSIGGSAFFKCSGLNSVTIPNSVTSIGGYAFSGCSGLTSVEVGNGVTSIEMAAFSSCSGLTGVYITDLAAWCKIDFKYADSNPLNYAENLYLNNAPITNLVIPDEITEIKNYTFRNAQNITGILTIPDGVTSIGDESFKNCSGLTSVEIGNGVTSIGKFAFDGCSGLTGVYITDLAAWCNIDFEVNKSNPLSCAKKLYLNNALITNLVIPDEITEIKPYTFYYANSITVLTLHDSVTSIGNYAFYDCSGLTGELVIPDSVTSIGNHAFYDCSGLTGEIVIPDGMTSIGDYAFSCCSGLTGELVIPDSVTSIGNHAFSSCNLTSVIIPDSAINIGEAAFKYCLSLKSVTILCGLESQTVVSYNSMLNLCSSLEFIYVPSDLVEQYKAADGWIDFADKIQAIPTT